MGSQGGGNVRLSVSSVQCEARLSGVRKVDLSPRLEHVVTGKMEFGSGFYLEREKTLDLWVGSHFGFGWG